MTLKPQNFRGWETLTNKTAAYAPYFSSAMRYRVNMKLATNVAVTGEAGIGKSYLTIDMCRALEGLTASGQDRFKMHQVVFTYVEYMKELIRLRMGKPLVFDEPSYAMGKRDWYKDVNKVLVQTIESQRFKVHPVFIPIINQALLDKTIRSYLLQYQVHVLGRGKAKVYRIYASQHTEKIYRYHFCDLEYGMFDSDLCARDTCLDCARLAPKDDAEPCQIFRAQYERKKASVQDVRYESALDVATQKETALLTDDEIAKRIFKLHKKYTNDDGHIDVDLLRIVARRLLHLKIGHNKAYRIAKMLKFDHPETFE